MVEPTDARRAGYEPRRHRRGVALLPSILTVGNMFCGYACVLYAMRGNLPTAAPLIGIAMVLDMLDGRIARLTGTSSAFGVLAQRLRAGKLVCLVCDRDVTGTGMEVEFFGEKARMMGGAAALAVQTGAALMPVILWFEGDQWGAHVHEQIPVPAEGDAEQKTAAMMQEVARLFEEGIRAHPQHWHMLQRIFTADLDPERLRRAAQGQ